MCQHGLPWAHEGAQRQPTGHDRLRSGVLTYHFALAGAPLADPPTTRALLLASGFAEVEVRPLAGCGSSLQ